MLSDPLVVPFGKTGLDAESTAILDYLAAGTTGTGVSMHTTDIGPGNSKRVGSLPDGTKVLMTVSHSTSKENAPYVTDRTLIRFDLTRIDGVSGKPVTASVYSVLAFPQGPNFTSAEVSSFAEYLGAFLIQGGLRLGGSAPRWNDLYPGDTTRRLLDGEA